MKNFAIAMTLLLTLSANKCANKADDNGSNMGSLMDSKWVFQSVAGSDMKMPEGVETPWLQLTGEQVQGFGGCNRLMGSYKMEGSKLSFPDLASTKMYCEATQATENAIKEAMGQVDSYKMDGKSLKLFGGGKELASLKAVEE